MADWCVNEFGKEIIQKHRNRLFDSTFIDVGNCEDSTYGIYTIKFARENVHI